MPHLNAEEANDLARVRERIVAAEGRNRRDKLGAQVLVGSTLLRCLIEDHDAMEQLRRRPIERLQMEGGKPGLV